MFYKNISKTAKFSVKQPNLTKGAIVGYLIAICVHCPIFPMSAHLTFGALLPCYTPIYHVSFCYENTRRKPGSPLTRRASLCLVLDLSTHGLDVSLFIECIYLFLKSPVRRASFASRDIEYCRYYSFLLDIANLSQIG